ncbi:MAG: methyl-accepting chemotaxis protein, partial [Burkholderiaceae bacterium]|nr:methyl-accepting chemotaxis protein [Burkholderiaceae bacterium]
MPFDLIRRPRKDAVVGRATAAGPAEPAVAGIDVANAIRALAHDASLMGRDAADLVGVLDDLAAAGRRQAEGFVAVSGQVDQMVAANTEISRSMGASLDSARGARAAVERVAADVTAAADTLREVADAAADITKIALQTRLVAFNASVEAKRAGEAGRGFAVVAEAVKDLAQKVEQSSKQIASTVQQLDTRIQELAFNIRSDGLQRSGNGTRSGQETFNTAFSRVEKAVADIAAAAEQNLRGCETTQQSVKDIAGQVQHCVTAIDGAKRRATTFLDQSERLVELSTDCGAETEDTPFIDRVTELAAAISARFEQALDQGELGEADLFDTGYVKIAGTQPQQVRTRYIDFTDRVLPAFQEPMLELSTKVVFCAAVDRNGYLPTHNLKFSKPQGADPVWNAAHCRNRRIFDDRTGLAAARNQRRFLLQTYRRDMGG